VTPENAKTQRWVTKTAGSEFQVYGPATAKHRRP